MKNRKNINKDEIVKVDILDVLLDENNTSNIVMKGDKGETLEMEQIAVIPYGEEELYALLKPVSKIDGVEENGVLVFKVEEDENGEAGLLVEEDEDKANIIFKQYYKLIFDENQDGNELLLEAASTFIKEKRYGYAKMMYEILAENGSEEAKSSIEAINMLIDEDK